MTRLLTILIVFTSLTLHTYGQINIGSSISSQGNSPGRLSDEEISDLKKSTTLFVLQKSDYSHSAEFEKVISSVWKVSKFKIIKSDEIETYAAMPGYTFFSFGTAEHDRPTKNGGTAVGTVHMTYDLWYANLNKKGKVKGRYYYARIMLSNNSENILAIRDRFSVFDNEKFLQYMYGEAHIDNWGAGYLKNYLQVINDGLMKGEMRGRYTSDENDKALFALRRDTLYVPDYINKRVSGNPFTAEGNDNDADEGSVKEVYHHPIKFLSAEELNNKILNETKPFYYLLYVRSATDKFVNVYHTVQGMVYARHTNLSYNFKYKDLGKLDDEMKK